MFHEFGHATHEMMSQSKHSELSGFHVEWDFVELPSQLLENWARHPDGLTRFARHVKTGEVIPEEMTQKMQALDTFGNGYFVVKQNEYAMMDMKLHSEDIPKNSDELTQFVYHNYATTEIFPLPETY